MSATESLTDLDWCNYWLENWVGTRSDRYDTAWRESYRRCSPDEREQVRREWGGQLGSVDWPE